MGEPRSQKQQREQLVRALRADGKSWVDVAGVLRQRYRVNPRVALRYAHGWSQRGVADEWNRRWPDELKTFKNFSYWELWPSSTGYAPSLDVLTRLAELYECRVADLLDDCADFRSEDPVYREKNSLSRLPALISESISYPLASGPDGTAFDFSELLSKLESIDAQELARMMSAWADCAGEGILRRALLLKLSAGLSIAALSPMGVALLE